MSHTRVMTTYSREGNYASTDTVELFCHHNHTCDISCFYYSAGDVVEMCFAEWESGNDLWDAMNRLWFPYENEWGGSPKAGVTFVSEFPWELKNK